MIDTTFHNLDITTSLEELGEIREIQAIVSQSVAALKADRTDSDAVKSAAVSLAWEARELEIEAAEIQEIIVQSFVNLRKHVAELQEELAKAPKKNPPIWSGWKL